MKGIRWVFHDWKLLWSHKHGRIALVFLLMVPLIYTGLFLAGYWDPYGRLDQLPVAVVNLDKGAVMDHKAIHVGDDFVKKLKENKELNFQFVSEKEANDGLKNGRYYMVITVPEDFSKKVTTLMDPHPQRAQLIYKVNEGKNFVASQIGSAAVKEMDAKIERSITKSYTEGVFEKMEELAQGLGKAADGASQLHKGTARAEKGVHELTDGVTRLTKGAVQLEQGSNRLSAGAHQLEKGMESLKQGTGNLSAGMNRLSAGHRTLETGVAQLSQGTKAWLDGNKKIQQGQGQLQQTANMLKSALAQYMQGHPDAARDPDLQKIKAISDGIAEAADALYKGQAQLAEGAEKLNAGQSQLEQGMKQFGKKMGEATAGAHQLALGADQLAAGFSKWETGFSSLDKGIVALANGEQRLYNGAEKLSNGLVQLTDGSGELSEKLREAAQKTSTIHADNAVATMFSHPVQLVGSKLHHVPNYGNGIAAYFLSLGLYVGGIIGANVLPLTRREGASATAYFVNKLGLFYSIGIIQTFIVMMIVLFGFHLHVTSVPLFILFSLLVSLTFMTFIFMLVSVFGLVGKFAAVTLLILQLSTCGGTFPMELNAPIMRAIGQWLPMTYSVRGFQDVIALGDLSSLLSHALMMLVYLGGAALTGWSACLIHSRKSAALSAHSVK
jgi:putative membrane protein